ncbi:hypothetical protein HOH87_07400 [bacterium]|jgi:proteasome lid subunit RPN8/RPN11|nr:hypothetical protein [bacterium]
MTTQFQITQRHYDIIIEQARKNYPQECGGFLGGKDMVISAILPTFNAHLYNKTDTFALSSEDMERAHAFFAKHNLEYYGVYHTHPKGEAIPSKQDLVNVQKYLFIISLRDIDNPDFAAYETTGAQQAQRVPLSIVTGNVEVMDIHGTGTEKQLGGTGNMEIDTLNTMMNDMINEKLEYPKTDPQKKDGSSDFSTLA